MCLVFADAGTLPAAVLDEAPASQRGAGLAAAATVANLSAFLGAAAVGTILNLAGGTTSPLAWLLAFETMGTGSIVGGALLSLSARR